MLVGVAVVVGESRATRQKYVQFDLRWAQAFWWERRSFDPTTDMHNRGATGLHSLPGAVAIAKLGAERRFAGRFSSVDAG